MEVSEALRQRRSIRDYTAEPVDQQLIADILEQARFAPSGGNLQPWRVIAVSGAQRDAVIALARENGAGDAGERAIYPTNLWEPYRSRRFKLGEDLYRLLDIPRDDKEGRLRQLARNYEFFGAPVGLFFVVDRRMGHAQWCHLGILMQSIALAALERGLATCLQEAWANHRTPLHRQLQLSDEEMVCCGMALGYASGALINTLQTERAELAEFVEFRGF